MQKIGEIPPFILLEIKLDIYLIGYYIGVFKKSKDEYCDNIIKRNVL